jgi:hypothetical protein
MFEVGPFGTDVGGQAVALFGVEGNGLYNNCLTGGRSPKKLPQAIRVLQGDGMALARQLGRIWYYAAFVFCWEAIDFQIIQFAWQQGGDRPSRQTPTDNTAKIFT